ncbi:MAG TPA: response regulator [Pyrinomonadaceae bacterium]
MENDNPASPIRSILCVDDDADTCELLQFVLDEYDFASAHSVEKTLALIETRRFDLYVFDNWMPDGSGVELCRKVRALGIDAPIIFVSGAAQTKDVEEALANGATRYLTKPCEPDVLKKIVKELIA